MNYLPQVTVKYKTYVKTATVEAFRDVFQHHKDTQLAKSKVTIEYPRTEADYPVLIVRFFEREVKNAGVGHEEWIKLSDGGTYRFKHYFYNGDLEFSVSALSSLDRDLMTDAVVQTLAMGDLEAYTNRFLERIYADEDIYPDAANHFITVNTDKISGFGETQVQVPWLSEDDLVYTASYRVGIFGEFYSLPPDLPAPLIEKITQYPYIEGVEPVPTGDPNDAGVWLP